MKKILFTASINLLAGVMMAQQGKDMVIIKGILKGDLKGYNKIYLYTRTTNDSAVIQDGHYSFEFPFTEPALRMLYPKYIQQMHQIYQPFGILISGPGTYYVTSDISKGMQGSELKGPEDMVLYKQFEDAQADAAKKLSAAMVKLYGEQWWQIAEKDKAYLKIQQSRDSLDDVFLSPLIEKLVKANPDSYASAFVLSGAGRQTGTIEKKEHWFSMLSKRMKNTRAARNFSDYINGLKASSVGNHVNNFVLSGPAGKNIEFQSLKGKYVLIDFWASWCVPCRRSFPHLREVYQKYKDSGFEIYSISIDEDRKAWLKAIAEEKNPWLQSLDTKNISQKGFAVTGIPASFLVDPNGVIIAREVGFDPEGGSAIEKKLQEVLN